MEGEKPANKDELHFADIVEEMRSCFQTCLSHHCESKRKRVSKEENYSFSVSPSIKDISVRIVHAGGRVEMYQKAIPASELIQKYPGMSVTWPCIFTHPHESVLSADDMLKPGNKYFIVRSTTVEKLKRRHKLNWPADAGTGTREPVTDSEAIKNSGDNSLDESLCSVKDFQVTKDKWSTCFLDKSRGRKKQFMPPIQKTRMWKVDWEPSLNSIKEVSP